MSSAQMMLGRFGADLESRNPGEAEFHRAVIEVAANILPFLEDHPRYREMRILERMAEPDRVVSFRVCWQDDAGRVRINRGYRVQMNNAIGPYKGGLRFHPSVNSSVLKFLAFEQIFKNGLTGLPLGAGKGGADFDPKGKSENEIMRFCQAFMTELYRHIGADVDVPAGDIGVGGREIGYLFGQHKRITGGVEGVLTGKAPAFGGSSVRPLATGYGAVYFLQDMMRSAGKDIEHRTVAVSGAGNVAVYAAEKLLQLGAKPVTLSDSDGFVHDPQGFTHEKLDWVKELKFVRRGRIRAYCDVFASAAFHPRQRPWSVPCDIAMPCATENELDASDAETLIGNRVQAVVEGANMPTTSDAAHALQEAGVLFGPGKAANAGGVAVSGLEMSQNAMRIASDGEQMQQRLRRIMQDIHDRCARCGKDYGRSGRIDYVAGANIAGFVKVADAMLALGVT